LSWTSRLLTWLRFVGIYWLNAWHLAIVYTFGKAWFLVSLAGFLPLLRAAVQHETQGQVQLNDPYRSEQDISGGYRPYGPDRLSKRLRQR